MKVLILGASGMIGSAMFRVLAAAPTLQVWGTLRSTTMARFFAQGLQTRLLHIDDIEQTDKLVRLLATIRPDVVIDPVVAALTANSALLYIRGTQADAAELVRRFRQNPKPMYYQPPFLVAKWAEFKRLNHVEHDADVDPDAFGAWGFEALLHDRLPRYQALADNFGYTIEATDLATVRDGTDFIALMGKAIRARMR